MSLQILKESDSTTIRLNEKFDFSGADDFRKAYEENSANNYVIDFRDTDYMDSSGLGILLNMRRAIPEEPISLINCKPQVKRVLVISRFDEQFIIS